MRKIFGEGKYLISKGEENGKGKYILFAEEKKNLNHLFVAFGLENVFSRDIQAKIRSSVTDFLSKLDLMPL